LVKSLGKTFTYPQAAEYARPRLEAEKKRADEKAAARKAKFDRPAAVVGVRAGKSRGDMNGAWYRWFVVSGTSGTRNTKSRGKVQIKAIRGRDFVKDAVTEPSNQARAIEALNKTVQAFLDGTIKYRRGRR
jgi:hypothetical protein